MTQYYNSSQAPEADDLSGGADNALLAECFDEFREALETLYILANMAGRNNFNKKWPVVAQRVLGAELIDYDLNGTKDLERRAALEMEAETRRIELLEMLDGVEDKSVYAGALQIEYVQRLIGSLGREMALYVYSKPIVNRFIPPSEEEAVEVSGVKEQPLARSGDEAVSDSDFDAVADLGQRAGEPLIEEFKMEDEDKDRADIRQAPPSVSAKPRTAADAEKSLDSLDSEMLLEEDEESLIRPIDTSTPQGHAAFDEPVEMTVAERVLSPLEVEQAKLMEQRKPEGESSQEPSADEIEGGDEKKLREDESLQPMTFMSARTPKD